MILDTSFIVDVMRNNQNAVKKLKEIIVSGEVQIITAPTIFELFSGISQSESSSLERRKVMYTLSHMVAWHLDIDAAEKSGEIHGELVSQGQQIDAIDSMIAGIALAKGENLLTRNLKHFSRIPGLKLETY